MNDRAHAAVEAFARDFGRRTALYLESCVHCGHCAEACPFYLETGDAKYTPIWKVELFKRAYRGKAVTEEQLREWEELVYDSCTMCGRCTAACPMGIDIASLVGQARHGMFAAGFVPPDLRASAERAATEGSPLGATPRVLRERVEWLADEHDVPIHLDRAKADVMVTFSSVEIMKYPLAIVATAKVLEHAGYSWTISSRGYEATNFGMLAGSTEWQRAMSLKIIEAAIACEAKTVVLPECGHAYTALRWQGANIYGKPLPFRVQHITEFLAENLENGRIQVEPLEQSVAFHDPCQLSRRGGAAQAPRRVLGALHADLRETEDCGELSFCCGGGGGVIANSRADALRRKALNLKMRQIDATGADMTLTSCANCRLSFDDGHDYFKWGRKMESLLELVADRLVG